MTIKRNNAEGGTAGVALTTANSGGASGDAWEAFGSTVAPVFSSSNPKSGTKSISYPAGSGQTSFHRWTSFTGTDVLESIRYIYLTEIPSPSTEMEQLRSAGGRIASWYVTNTAKIDMQDSVQGSQYMSTMSLATNTGYYIRIWAKRGTTTSNGEMQLDIFNASMTLLESSGKLTGRNTGTAIPTEVRAGKTSASTWVSTNKLFTDEWQASNEGTTGPTLLGYPGAPVEIGGFLSYNPHIDVRSSTGDGTITYSISPTTGVSEPVEGLFLVPAVTDSSPVDYTVTATNGSSSDTQVFTVSQQATIAQGQSRVRVWSGSAWI